MKRSLNSAQLLLVLLPMLSLSNAYANTPAEMVDLSLQELYALSVDDNNQDYGFQAGVLFKREVLDGYKSGTESLSYDDVLFQPPEPRTDKNYPVLPTVIERQTLVINLSIGIDEKSSASISLPYIEQNTDHLSIVPGYDEFNIASSGLGDIAINYQRLVHHNANQKISIALGLSMPTGSIDEKGDTPRAEGDQQLPYTMQLGSGTFDIPLGVNFSRSNENYSAGVNLYAKFRFIENDRNYRLGNKFAATAWAKYEGWLTFEPTIKVTYINWGEISGQDDEITVPGNFPYPAGITDPSNYGGQQINLSANLLAYLGDQQANIEVTLPVYHDLNGVQPKQKLGFSIQWHQQF